MNTISKGTDPMMSYWRTPNMLLPKPTKDLIVVVYADNGVNTRIAEDFVKDWEAGDPDARNAKFWIFKP